MPHNRAGVLSQITPVIIVRPAAAKYCEKLLPCTQAGIAFTYTLFTGTKTRKITVLSIHFNLSQPVLIFVCVKEGVSNICLCFPSFLLKMLYIQLICVNRGLLQRIKQHLDLKFLSTYKGLLIKHSCIHSYLFIADKQY